MSHRWAAGTVFRRVHLDVVERVCSRCQAATHVCGRRSRRFWTLAEPVLLSVCLRHCSDSACLGHRSSDSPPEELAWAMPYWAVGWDLFVWIGHRRFARHWSVPQIRQELADSRGITLSDDAIEEYCDRYQTMLAARERDLDSLRAEYRGVEEVQLSIDGLQPEKGHETLYVVRELTHKRVWFAEPLLSSTTAEVQELFVTARELAATLGVRVGLWMSDKQEAFVQGIAAEFPAIPHRYCQNHFLRDVAAPMLEQDSHAKVKLRSKVRGLRAIERDVLQQQRQATKTVAEPFLASASDSLLESATATSVTPAEPASPTVIPSPCGVAAIPLAASSASPHSETAVTSAAAVVLEYCAAVRGILNDDQGGPLHPPGLRMAAALQEVRQSLRRNLDAQKGGSRNVN